MKPHALTHQSHEVTNAEDGIPPANHVGSPYSATEAFPAALNILLLTVACCLLNSCATRTTAPVETVRLPAKPNAAPVVAAMTAPVDAVDSSNRSLEAGLAGLKREASAARAEASRATAEAKQLAAAGTATGEQLNRLWQDMQAQEARNLFLEQETGRMAVVISDQRRAIDDARKKLGDAVTAASGKDQEVETMRALRESDERIKRDLAADVAKRDQQILGLTDELGKAKPYRRWCVAGGIIAALYVVATLVLKFWKPF